MKKLARCERKAFHPRPRLIALDLDGVVYTGDAPLPGAVEEVRRLRRAGYLVRFITNNSGSTREGVARKLSGMGIETAAEEVVTSGYAARVLLEGLSRGRASSVLVIGTSGLKGELFRAGFSIVDQGACEYLVVGLDPEFSYEKIAHALDALRSGATFVACNRDRTFPSGDGRVRPGCGAIVAAIEWAWGSECPYEAGKPGTLMLEMLGQREGVAPDDILVVGDGLESDIAMARLHGSPAVLVKPGGCEGEVDIAEGEALLVIDGLPALREFL